MSFMLILVLLACAVMAILGAMSMFLPKVMVNNLAVEPVGAAGLSTIRSVMGALFLGSFAMLVMGLRTGDVSWYVPVMVLMAVAAVGRIVSIVLDGFGRHAIPALAVEFGIIAILASAQNQSVTG